MLRTCDEHEGGGLWKECMRKRMSEGDHWRYGSIEWTVIGEKDMAGEGQNGLKGSSMVTSMEEVPIGEQSIR